MVADLRANPSKWAMFTDAAKVGRVSSSTYLAIGDEGLLAPPAPPPSITREMLSEGVILGRVPLATNPSNAEGGRVRFGQSGSVNESLDGVEKLPPSPPTTTSGPWGVTILALEETGLSKGKLGSSRVLCAPTGWEHSPSAVIR